MGDVAPPGSTASNPAPNPGSSGPSSDSKKPQTQADNSAFTLPKAKPEEKKEKKDPMLELLDSYSDMVKNVNSKVCKALNLPSFDELEELGPLKGADKLVQAFGKNVDGAADAIKGGFSKFADWAKSKMPSMSAVQDTPGNVSDVQSRATTELDAITTPTTSSAPEPDPTPDSDLDDKIGLASMNLGS